MDKALERLAGGGSHGAGGTAPSKGFQMLIKGIAEAKTKHVRTTTFKALQNALYVHGE